jgi:hypothetical protein
VAPPDFFLAELCFLAGLDSVQDHQKDFFSDE